MLIVWTCATSASFVVFCFFTSFGSAQYLVDCSAAFWVMFHCLFFSDVVNSFQVSQENIKTLTCIRVLLVLCCLCTLLFFSLRARLGNANQLVGHVLLLAFFGCLDQLIIPGKIFSPTQSFNFILLTFFRSVAQHPSLYFALITQGNTSPWHYSVDEHELYIFILYNVFSQHFES